MTAEDDVERLLTPWEVSQLFRVDPRTVTRWAKAGRISAVRTPGGHRRYRESEVHTLRGRPSEGGPEVAVIREAGTGVITPSDL